MIEMATEWLGIHLIGKALTRRDQAGARHPVHACGVDRMEMDRVRMGAGIDEVDAQPFAFDASQRRSGDAALIGPGRKKNARRDFDFLVDGGDGPFTNWTPVESGRDIPVIELGQELLGCKPIRLVIDRAYDLIGAAPFAARRSGLSHRLLGGEWNATGYPREGGDGLSSCRAQAVVSPRRRRSGRVA